MARGHFRCGRGCSDYGGVPLGKCASDGVCVLIGKAGGGVGNVPRRRCAPSGQPP